MFLKRTTILYFVLPALGLGALAFALLALPLGLGNGASTSETAGGILVYILGLCGGGALLLTAWILALVQTAQRKRWGWFGVLLAEAILTVVSAGLIGFYFPWAFLILPLTVAIYGFVGPTTSQSTNPKPLS
jgi:hypothetical protein